MRHKLRGFSLIELMIVLVIIMLVAGMATPSMTRAISTIRLRAGASSVAGLLQKGRIEAVRSNRIMVIRQDVLSDGVTPIFYVDGANDPTKKVQDPATQNAKFDSWEPLVQINNNISLQPEANAPAFPYLQLLGYNNGPSTLPFAIPFNQRGLPCSITTQSGGQVTGCALAGIGYTATSSSSYQYFFRYRSIFGDRWASVSVTPAGRIRVWTWDGKNWS
jgi:prepilin-type N-terminal cleavage/methylation domain-containing protein